MAKRKILFVLGQSHATTVSDAASWEDQHPTIALRKPTYGVLGSLGFPGLLPQFPEGGPRELFTMPGVFAGGGQSGLLGDGPRTSVWQTVDCSGKVVNAVRFLTHYNPVASGLNLGTTVTSVFPGTGSISFGSTPTTLLTSTRWQYDPQGLVITRVRTGTQHTIQPPRAVSLVNVGTETITCAAHECITGDPVYLSGTTAPDGVALLTQYYAIVVDATNLRLATSVANAHAGTVILLGPGAGASLSVHRGFTTPGNAIAITPAMVPPPETGEQFTFTPTGGAASSTTELKLKQAFGGLAEIGSTYDVPPYCELATLHGADFYRGRSSAGVSLPGRVACRSRFGYAGAPIVFSAGALPTGVTAGATYYITRYAGDDEVLTVAGWTDTRAVAAWNDGADQLTVTAHGMLDDEPISFTGTLAAGVTVGVTYYVLFVDANTIQLRDSLGGPAKVFGAGGGAATLTRLAAVRITAHSLGVTEKIRFSGSLPTGVLSTLDYYVYVSDHNTILLGHPVPTTLYEPVGTGGGAATATRIESFCQFYIATSPGGPELHFDSYLYGVNTLSFSVHFRGSLTGTRIRALTGSNAGQSVPAGDIYLSGGIHTITLGSAFSNAPASGDTYVIEVPPIDGQDVPFEKWALFLPWCPFEGSAKFNGPFPAPVGSLSETVGEELVAQATAMDVWPGDMLRIVNGGLLYGSAMPTDKLRFGVRYFSSAAALGASFLAASYGGSTIVGTTTAVATGGQNLYLLRQDGKSNPFPPGFNYPNHLTNLGDYQPFDGPSIITAPKQTFTAGLAVALAEFYGEPIYVVQLAVGGTNLGHTDVPPATFGLGVNTSDPKRQLSWAPTGDTNNIFQRLTDVLDAAVLALRAQGDEGEGIGVVWVQGEGDSTYEHLANRYLVNGRRFRAAVRQAIVDRGLFSRPAAELKWIEPYCQTIPWPYSSTVRAAKDVLVAEDPYSGLCELDDLPRLNSLPGTANGDVIHMTGAGASTLERRIYDAWIGIGETNLDVDLANMALALIGEPAKVFSLDTAVDQSAQAAECAKFLPVAKEVILESHSWAFATKMLSLTASTKDALRTDWSYAYEIPFDLLNVLEVLPQGSTSSIATPTEITPWWRSPSASDTVYPNGHLYAIEPNAAGRLVLYTNVESAVLRYVKRITAAAAVPMKFKTAVARKLASLIAGQFVKGEAGAMLAQRLDAMSRADTGDAAATDAKHRQNKPNSQDMPWNRE